MFYNIIIPLAHYLIYGRICTPINNGVWWISVENNWSKHEKHEVGVMKKIIENRGKKLPSIKL